MSDIMQPWPKTPRYFRETIVTEKIDGTAAGILILPRGKHTPEAEAQAIAETECGFLWARSRNRMITPESDNYGYAAWVGENADVLATVLGVGAHYGEWWGQGIQRGYGLDHKRFSLYSSPALFEVPVSGADELPALGRVPEMGRTCDGADELVRDSLELLERFGSAAAYPLHGQAAPAEGVCVYHTQSRQIYKALIDADHLSKTEALEAAA